MFVSFGLECPHAQKATYSTVHAVYSGIWMDWREIILLFKILLNIYTVRLVTANMLFSN